jgi:hypothetical protein
LFRQKTTINFTKGKSAEASVKLTPNVYRLKSSLLVSSLEFRLVSYDNQLENTQSLEIRTNPLQVRPQILRPKGPLFKGRPFSLSLNIDKPNERCVEIPIRVKVLAEPDFRLNHPKIDEFIVESGASPMTIFITPRRAGLPGYLDELNLIYYFKESQLVVEREKSNLRFVVLPNVLDSSLAAVTGVGGILYQYGIIPNPSGDLASGLPNLSILGLVLYLGSRIAMWTYKTQQS